MKTKTTGVTGITFSTDRKTGIGSLKQGTTCPDKSGDFPIGIASRQICANWGALENFINWYKTYF